MAPPFMEEFWALDRKYPSSYVLEVGQTHINRDTDIQQDTAIDMERYEYECIKCCKVIHGINPAARGQISPWQEELLQNMPKNHYWCVYKPQKNLKIATVDTFPALTVCW